MTEPYDRGNYVLAIYPQRVRFAANALLKYVDRTQLRKVKIRSGEHLALILTTAFIGAIPRALDHSGGPDIEFDVSETEPDDLLRETVFTSTSVAFEIKSPDAGYRKFEGAINADVRADRSPRNPQRSVMVQSAQTILEQSQKWIQQARDQLAKKTTKGTSRNVFIVIHMLDFLPAEFMDGILAPALDPIDVPDLDSVWILWGANLLTVWSTQRQEWINFLFSATPNEEELQDLPDDMDFLQEVEREYLSGLGITDGSPYLFGLSATAD